MKKIIILMAILMMFSAMPMAFAAGDGGSVHGGIEVEEFEPLVFQCGGRVILDDDVQPGRITGEGDVMAERNQQYLFDGERYQVDVLVFDKNKIESDDVELILEGERRTFSSCVAVCRDIANREITTYTTEETCIANGVCLASSTYQNQQACISAGGTWVDGVCLAPSFTNRDSCLAATGVWVLNTWTPACIDTPEEIFTPSPINCIPSTSTSVTGCNIRIDEEAITTFDAKTMKRYTCFIDILDSERMYGLHWLKVRATSGFSGEEGEYAEIARWFINPTISLSVDGDLDFSDARPGTASYRTVLLENTAEGGVLLDMFITGKDWPAVTDGAELGRCLLVDANGANHVPTTYVNYLPLGAFRYYAENGAFSTRDDAGTEGGLFGPYNPGFDRDSDPEGYVNINKQLNAGFEEAMFDDAEIIQANQLGPYYMANILYPNSAGMSVTFKLTLPEPCYGEYDSPSDGSIFFWAEAI
ncbi:MAG: hypothetical protein PHF67_03530 [Candidatus Nanoarchaeia archaeon]|nr:hypothetical protein [Candidatus Nanoarchaeia archaeon]